MFLPLKEGYHFAAANFGRWALAPSLPEADKAAETMTPDKGVVYSRYLWSQRLGRLLLTEEWFEVRPEHRPFFLTPA